MLRSSLTDMVTYYDDLDISVESLRNDFSFLNEVKVSFGLTKDLANRYQQSYGHYPIALESFGDISFKHHQVAIEGIIRTIIDKLKTFFKWIAEKLGFNKKTQEKTEKVQEEIKTTTENTDKVQEEIKKSEVQAEQAEKTTQETKPAKEVKLPDDAYDVFSHIFAMNRMNQELKDAELLADIIINQHLKIIDTAVASLKYFKENIHKFISTVNDFSTMVKENKLEMMNDIIREVKELEASRNREVNVNMYKEAQELSKKANVLVKSVVKLINVKPSDDHKSAVSKWSLHDAKQHLTTVRKSAKHREYSNQANLVKKFNELNDYYKNVFRAYTSEGKAVLNAESNLLFSEHDGRSFFDMDDVNEFKSAPSETQKQMLNEIYNPLMKLSNNLYQHREFASNLIHNFNEYVRVFNTLQMKIVGLQTKLAKIEINLGK